MKSVKDLSEIVKEREVFNLLRSIQEKAFLTNVDGIIRFSRVEKNFSTEIVALKKALKKNNGSRFDGMNDEEMFKLIIKPAFFIFVGKEKQC
jgi:hypothetical protein